MRVVVQQGFYCIAITHNALIRVVSMTLTDTVESFHYMNSTRGSRVTGSDFAHNISEIASVMYHEQLYNFTLLLPGISEVWPTKKSGPHPIFSLADCER